MKLRLNGNGLIWGGWKNFTFDLYKFGLTVKWPLIILSWANSYPQKGGELQDWCKWIKQINLRGTGIAPEPPTRGG